MKYKAKRAAVAGMGVLLAVSTAAVPLVESRAYESYWILGDDDLTEEEREDEEWSGVTSSEVAHGKATDSDAWFDKATGSNAVSDKVTGGNVTPDKATGSNAVLGNVATPSIATMSSSLGDLWNDWHGNLAFTDGTHGDGSEESPYQISTIDDLMGLSELVASGADCDGVYFELTANINLQSVPWNPIGFYQNANEIDGDVAHPFTGHFDGNGHTISNLTIMKDNWRHAGLFGAVSGAVIENLNLKNVRVTAMELAGGLAGAAEETIIRNCTAEGSFWTSGVTGGLAGSLSGDSLVENCDTKPVIYAASSPSGHMVYVGGIAGETVESDIVDCTVATGNGDTSRIAGKGVVGGITGRQNESNIYNVSVSGTIGGPLSTAIGGIVGEYQRGNLKVARFSGVIGNSGLGSSKHEGCFIGTRTAPNYFRFGTSGEDQVAYLFADSAAKVAANVCGSGLIDDNRYTYGAHIGFWHGKDAHFTLAQGSNTQVEEELYFYEELEAGIQKIITEDLANVVTLEGQDDGVDYSIDHVAPGNGGTPIRGYLVSIPQVDTTAGGQAFYDVATITAKAGATNTYYREINQSQPSAVAPGVTVQVSTAPNNEGDKVYQIDGKPQFKKQSGDGYILKDTSYVTGGGYTFTMPSNNTEITAKYIKMATKISVSPETYRFKVVQTRTGDRKNPVITTEVFNTDQSLIATYINGQLKEGTVVQPVYISCNVQENGDVEDSTYAWAIDDGDLLNLLNGGTYGSDRAELKVNVESGFINRIITAEEKKQSDSGYQSAIPNTLYTSKAVLTASTKGAYSQDGKPAKANCKVEVSFQIEDQTKVWLEGVSLNHSHMDFTVTRTLTGDRKAPQEKITVTPSGLLSAELTPAWSYEKGVTWSDAQDERNLKLDRMGQECETSVRTDAAWITHIIENDRKMWSQGDGYSKQDGAGEQTTTITATAQDKNAKIHTADCTVQIHFKTDDQTVIYPEAVAMDQDAEQFELLYTRAGEMTGGAAKTLSAAVKPDLQPASEFLPYDRGMVWTSSDPSVLKVDQEGNITPVMDAEWIAEAMKVYPYEATKTVAVYAETTAKRPGSGVPAASAACQITLHFKREAAPVTYTSGGGSSSGGGGGSSSVKAGTAGTIRSSLPVSLPDYVITGGTWSQTEDGKWKFAKDGRTCAGEWAALYNPYADTSKGMPAFDWFRFDDQGHMVTGWYTDKDGNQYYLHELSDGTKGHMYTGWHELDGKMYYFQEQSDGTRGAWKKDVER